MSKPTDAVAKPSAATLALIAEYHEVVKTKDEIEAKREALRARIVDALDGADADKFVDETDTVLVSRVAVRRESLDKAYVLKHAKATYAKALKVSEGYRIDIPRIKR